MLSASCSLNQLKRLVVVDKGEAQMGITVFSPEKSWVYSILNTVGKPASALVDEHEQVCQNSSACG
jgi:hypothetical protein